MKLVSCVLASLSIGAAAPAQSLIGIHWDTGDLYLISPANAAVSLIGSTGVSQIADIEFGPNGRLYALRVGAGMALELWVINPWTAAATLVGPLGFNGYEGDLAFSSGVLHAAHTWAYEIVAVDTATGAATVATTFTTYYDLNGLAARSDGMLLGLDQLGKKLRVIDPATGTIVRSFPISPSLGAVGGMTNHAGQTYFCTGAYYGPPGSNELWTIDPFTGQHSLVGPFNWFITGTGISGLAGWDCSPPASYCTAGSSTGGCVPAMSSTGIPSAAATSGFTLRCSGLDGQKPAIVFFGIGGEQASPWAIGSTSYLCVKSPVQRTFVQLSGGALGNCDGQIGIDFLAYMAAHPSAIGQPLAPGRTFRVQTWYRDPPAPKSTNLSDGLRFTMCP